jgi:hypothetical protein
MDLLEDCGTSTDDDTVVQAAQQYAEADKAYLDTGDLAGLRRQNPEALQGRRGSKTLRNGWSI